MLYTLYALCAWLSASAIYLDKLGAPMSITRSFCINQHHTVKVHFANDDRQEQDYSISISYTLNHEEIIVKLFICKLREYTISLENIVLFMIHFLYINNVIL